jgi:hypothetical protein
VPKLKLIKAKHFGLLLTWLIDQSDILCSLKEEKRQQKLFIIQEAKKIAKWLN